MKFFTRIELREIFGSKLAGNMVASLRQYGGINIKTKAMYVPTVVKGKETETLKQILLFDVDECLAVAKGKMINRLKKVKRYEARHSAY